MKVTQTRLHNATRNVFFFGTNVSKHTIINIEITIIDIEMTEHW
jgi:hypothetical protein